MADIRAAVVLIVNENRTAVRTLARDVTRLAVKVIPGAKRFASTRR